MGAARLFQALAGETSERWSWVERSVWTERMLNHLAESQEQTVWNWFRGNNYPPHGCPC